ncbi:uncharacterized protein JCM10292_000198 [Rhodotorula paludigena]|uniref:uncharacterized protein n=1 Tax=Rhodotorula paludigena TaxID=86838 RepID=UPI003175E937
MSAPVYDPFVVAPPLTCCESAYLVYGQGQPPYQLDVIATGDSNGTSLESLPLLRRAGVYEWRVDFNEGANITFALTDGTGRSAYSQFRVVQAGEVTTCPKTDYTQQDSSSTNVGAIVGGVLGALAALALLFAFLWYRRRQRKQRIAAEVRAEGDKVLDADDVALTDGPAGVVRAGTFNLGTLDFTEQSLDTLRAIDRPPAYPARRSTTEDVSPALMRLDEEQR